MDEAFNLIASNLSFIMVCRKFCNGAILAKIAFPGGLALGLLIAAYHLVMGLSKYTGKKTAR